MCDTAGELAEGLQFLRLSQLLLDGEPFADVHFDGDETLDPIALSTDRRNGRGRGEQGAVLAPVPELARPGLPGSDGGPQLPKCRFGGFVAFPEVRLPADHFAPRVAGDLAHLGVDVLDRPAVVGDDDHAEALLDRLIELAQSRLGLPSRPDVGRVEIDEVAVGLGDDIHHVDMVPALDVVLFRSFHATGELQEFSPRVEIARRRCRRLPVRDLVDQSLGCGIGDGHVAVPVDAQHRVRVVFDETGQLP